MSSCGGGGLSFPCVILLTMAIIKMIMAFLVDNDQDDEYNYDAVEGESQNGVRNCRAIPVLTSRCGLVVSLSSSSHRERSTSSKQRK